MQYIIRFEDGKRIVTILAESPQDKDNKVEQAEQWAKGNAKRKVVVSDDGRNYIKLVNGKIKKMTQKEIDDAQPKPSKTEKECLLDLLEDSDIKDKIIAIIGGN